MYPLSGAIIEVTIEADEHELICQHSTDVSHMKNPRDTLHFLLTRGAATRENTDNRLEVQRSNFHDSTTQHDAIAYYLGSLDARSELSEDEAYGLLIDAGVDMIEYEQWRNSFNRRRRANRLLADSKERVRHLGSAIDYAVLTGSCPIDGVKYNPSRRSTDPPEDVVAVAAEWRANSIDANSCYVLAFAALHTKLFEAYDDVRYCEGLAMSSHPARASTHAWVEVDSEVVELLWNWDGPAPSDETIYYGDSIPFDAVIDVTNRRPTHASVLTSDEQYFEMEDVKSVMASRLFG
ncbi:hypothetical protein [Halorubrum sp. SP9]|uniref:hypothetical protein n=1 Tax=Halorubrum sp. SP9 TaxID=1537267 RepID=UPI0010F60004|nr:hypothetical protein [Halorubrum sp. SP9]TKX65674.1 hypothetical protein EXE45_15925 [Halorubrum sp. SP9]